MGQLSKNGIFWLAIILLTLTVYSFVKKKSDVHKELPYSEFVQEVQKDLVASVNIEGSLLTGTYRKKSEQFKTVIPKDDTLMPLLLKNNIEVAVKEPADQSSYLFILFNALPMLFLLAVWFFFLV